MVIVIGSRNMNIILNGKNIEVNDKKSLQDFLNTNIKSLPPYFVVELNNKIIYKEQYSKILLKEGDMIELATFVGGG